MVILNPSELNFGVVFFSFSELKDSLSRMGSDLKQGFISSLKSAWQTLNEFARAHTSSTQLQAELEKVANQIKEEEEKQVVEGTWTHYWFFCNLLVSNQLTLEYPRDCLLLIFLTLLRRSLLNARFPPKLLCRSPPQLGVGEELQ